MNMRFILFFFDRLKTSFVHIWIDLNICWCSWRVVMRDERVLLATVVVKFLTGRDFRLNILRHKSMDFD